MWGIQERGTCPECKALVIDDRCSGLSRDRVLGWSVSRIPGSVRDSTQENGQDLLPLSSSLLFPPSLFFLFFLLYLPSLFLSVCPSFSPFACISPLHTHFETTDIYSMSNYLQCILLRNYHLKIFPGCSVHSFPFNWNCTSNGVLVLQIKDTLKELLKLPKSTQLAQWFAGFLKSQVLPHSTVAGKKRLWFDTKSTGNEQKWTSGITFN